MQEALLWLSPRLAVRSAGQAASAQGGQKVLWARPSAAAHAFALVKMNDTPPADTHQPELFAANQRKQPRVAPLLGETRVVKVRLQRRAEGISMFWLFSFLSRFSRLRLQTPSHPVSLSSGVSDSNVKPPLIHYSVVSDNENVFFSVKLRHLASQKRKCVSVIKCIVFQVL